MIGAGPAGLTAAYFLCLEGKGRVTVLEADDRNVGGISRTVVHRGFRFDIGGHRFFSRSEFAENFWTDMLGDEMLVRERLSRIYYRGKFYSYPLKPLEALLNLGIRESCRCAMSYALARAFPVRNPRTFQEWVTNQFGERLFSIFFETYTEKVWGMKCSEISADWAAQRIQNLSLLSAVARGIWPGGGGNPIKTLIGSFRYPRLGPGMMWEKCAERVASLGGRIVMGARVVRVERGEDGKWTTVDRHGNSHVSGHVVVTSPLGGIHRMLGGVAGDELRADCEALRYRDFLTVVLLLRRGDEFPDQWIYVHDPGVRVGRIQNFRSWSPDMVPDDRISCYGMEYFCFEGDGLWGSEDELLVRVAWEELRKLGLADGCDLVEGVVVRQAKAYPVYDGDYRDKVARIRAYAEKNLPGIHFAGRNGMHKYNNQDHSMLTGMIAARNILSGEFPCPHDAWEVNCGESYHEGGGRLQPRRGQVQ